jgi:hypothetical protein
MLNLEEKATTYLEKNGCTHKTTQLKNTQQLILRVLYSQPTSGIISNSLE